MLHPVRRERKQFRPDLIFWGAAHGSSGATYRIVAHGCIVEVSCSYEPVSGAVPPSVYGATFELILEAVTVTGQRRVFFRVPN